VQEAASMIPPIVLDPQPGEVVLDLCAAPGSKTTQIAQYMENTGVLVANDITTDRIAALGINLQRCGVSNVVVTQMNAMRNQQFDKILLDAPCSGTGTIRKSLKTLMTWSLSATKKVCTTQHILLDNAWPMLKKGGTLVYSTCSLEPEEDEAMVSHFLGKHPDADIEEITLPINHKPGVTVWEGDNLDPRVAKTLRIWPQENDTEGFFVAKIVKR
jgi:NOL1/NOP2/sun family putative RNA methylase